MRNRLSWSANVALILFLLTGWLSTTPAARVEDDPNKDYQVTPEVGPCMIIVSSYSGPSRLMAAVSTGRGCRAAS